MIPRNSPRASQLITAIPGDEREIVTRGVEEYLEIDEVRTFDGATGFLSPGRKPDFRMMSLTTRGRLRPSVVEHLRASVDALDHAGNLQPPKPEVVKEISPAIVEVAAAQPPAKEIDPTWLKSWDGVYLASTESQSLGHEFFTRTTVAQETTLNVPRGLTFVEGVAGAGKTSVALGRLKFFSNFSTGEHLDDYGLKGVPLKDFSPLGMMGFVLSHGLKRYLRDTASALDLARLPIRDFDDFKLGLATDFGVAKAFRSRRAEQHSLRSRMFWLRALDVATARSAGAYLRKAIEKDKKITDSVKKAVVKLADDLERAQPSSTILHLQGLAAQVEKAVAAGEGDARRRELEAQEASIRSRFFSDRRERDRRLSQLHASFERKAYSAVSRELLSGLRAQDLFLAAVKRDDLVDLVRATLRLDKTSNSAELDTIEEAIAGLRTLLADVDDEGRPSLGEVDLVAVLGLAALISIGFESTGRQTKDVELAHLYDMRVNTCIFIDEVQDFNEVQVFLMGLSVTGAYNQITLSGDRCQQLHERGARKYAHLFPLVPRAQTNNPVFLAQNFRQRGALARLSAGVRSKLLGDERVAVEEGSPALLHAFDDRSAAARVIAKRVKQIDRHATVAVLCASKADAREWFNLLEDDLMAEHRPPLMSERGDLTRRFDVHFTDALEAKGLEFDVVFVPDIASFFGGDLIDRNGFYVAVSRARHSLFMACPKSALASTEIVSLMNADLLAQEVV